MLEIRYISETWLCRAPAAQEALLQHKSALMYIQIKEGKKVKISLLQAVEAHRFATGRGSHIS
jgi:hypothetical protein